MFDNVVSTMQTLLYINVVQPFLFKADLMGYDEDTFDALYWVIVGVLEVLVMYVILRPLEALRPAEKWQDRKGVRVDALYTWIVKLGILNLFFSSLSSRSSTASRAGCGFTISQYPARQPVAGRDVPANRCVSYLSGGA